MKAVKITYWISTSLVAVMMTFSAYMYFTNAEVMESFHHAGFPDYFRMELGIAKFIGAILLLVPVWPRVKEWVYAGFGITFISACIAHIASGDPINMVIAPMFVFVLLLVSYITYHKKQKNTLSIV